MDRFWMVIHSQGSVFEARFNYESFKIKVQNVVGEVQYFENEGEKLIDEVLDVENVDNVVEIEQPVDERKHKENRQQEVDKGMISQVIDQVVEGQPKLQKLIGILDDVEDGINKIFRDIQEVELEFIEGNADDVIP
uniref:Uncharacterized protein n=1 Tax=Lactuca sativa TaxID=4236 RepID=A0A9R1US82_LACSA|nr:hypothetical protein LSAT_V11C800429300 [Lactuca sativa]